MGDSTDNLGPATGTTAGASLGKKQFIINAFVMNTPCHTMPGLWRHPENKTDQYKKLGYWIELARMLDDAGFHALFIADVLGPYDVYKGPHNVVPALSSGAQFPVHDPLYLVPSMASATKNLIFGITASTTYNHPYALARRLSTVDHLAEGRLAWNIVTSYLESAALNHGLNDSIPHDERYAMAHEYLDVVYKLWEGSFRDDAVVADRETGVYIASDAVRPIAHHGKYYNVPGTHFCEPSPQRTPFLFQAGVSESGNGFGGKHGEAIFVSGQTVAGVKRNVDKIHQTARGEGRKPEHIKVILAVNVILGATDAEAAAKADDYRRYTDREGVAALFGGWTGIDLAQYDDDANLLLVDSPRTQSVVQRWATTVPGSDGLPWTKSRIIDFLSIGGNGVKVTGSAATVADALEHWADATGVDGFNFGHATSPGTYLDIIQYLLPELQRRGRFRTRVEKEGATAREVFLGAGTARLPEDHPGSRYKWRAGEAEPAWQAGAGGEFR